MNTSPNSDAPQVAVAPRETRSGTTPLTWACTVIILVAILGGLYWWYTTQGPGRTVDASAVKQGMTQLEVCKVLGDPDDTVNLNGETAMRYGRTHVWLKGVPGRGGVVNEVTNGAR